MPLIEARNIFPICVVILNWNLPEITETSITSIQTALLRGVRIVIVDNGSTDDSPGYFRRRFGNQVIIVENRANLGFAAGVNVGIRRALADGARAVLLLNNDTRAETGLIDYLVSAAIERPRAGILGPVIY